MSKLDHYFISSKPEETQAWGMKLAHSLPRGTIIALHGDLGAGKTCLVQGLARGLDAQESVHSPTFTLINEYHGRMPLYHLDLYRLRGQEDALEIGIEQYLPSDGITVIEWADRIAGLLPENVLHVLLEHGDEPNKRIIKIIPSESL